MTGGGGVASGAMDSADVVPMEDAIDALMEYLVAPLLPLRVSLQEAPTDDQQEAVARQIHAVVLLYNYYHRKQFPQLEFLAFETFCKSASVAKPSFLTYLKYMNKYNDGSGDPDKQLSFTEKKIKDACNISVALDASNNAPNMEGWPILKVAVFLVNHMKERCLLQFGSLTQGVWSLLEQELEEPIDSQVGSTQRNNNESKNQKIASEHSHQSCEKDYVLQQLAFSIVEQKAGINHANVCILEHHLAYSLSQEKATTGLYIMKYAETVSEELREVHIKDVISSLKGPLVRKALTPEVTTVVEHYNLLPYADILSDWLNRETLHDGSLHLPRLANVNEKCSLVSDRVPIVEDTKTNSKSDWCEPTVDKMSNTENKSMAKNENSASSNSGSLGSACRSKASARILSVEPDKMPTMEDQVASDESFQNEQTVDMLSSKNRIKKTAANNITIDGSNMSGSSAIVCRPHKRADNSSLNQCQQTLVNKEDMKENNISYTPTDKRKKKNIWCTAGVTLHGCNDMASMVDSAKPCTTKGTDGELQGKTDMYDAVQDEITTFDLPLIPLQLDMENQDAFQLVMASKKDDLLQASLRALQKRRDDLCQQQRILEDEIARCEMHIQTILSEGEENSKPKVESIIEACNVLCSSQMHAGTSLCSGEGSQAQKIKRRRLAEAVLMLRSSCQELDDICHENNWILPRYSVLPSISGRFQASVTLKGMDFECAVGGDLKSSPHEARESAATHMLSKLRSMAGQTL